MTILADDFYYQPIRLDTINTRVFADLVAKEGDANGRGLLVTLTENGLMKDTTGIALNLKWEHTAVGNQGLDNFEIVDLTKGQYKITYPTEMLNRGKVNAFIQILDGGKNAGSRNIEITVDRGVGDDTAIASSDSFSALASALIEVQSWNARIDAVEADFIQRANHMEEIYPQELISLGSQLAETISGIVNVKLGFGAKGDGITDDTPAFQAAVDFAKAHNIKTIYIPTGVYIINGTVYVSDLTAFDITFVGDGLGRDGRGVSLVKTTSGYIIDVDLTYASGSWRAVNFSNITFRGNTLKTARGIKVVHAQMCHFYNCEWLQVDVGVLLTGDSHYPKFEKCQFSLGNKGTYVPLDDDPEFVAGNANNGIITQCFFTYMETPVELGDGYGWSWDDSDFEGSNGTIVISSDNILKNIRIERNLNNIAWVKIVGDGNKIQCAVHAAGGNTPNVLFEILGDDNEIELLSSSGITMLDSRTTGKNNVMRVGKYTRILPGILLTGDYGSTNVVKFNETTSAKQNLALYSHDPTEWAIDSGTRNIIHKPELDDFIIAKTSAEDLLIHTTIPGTFEIGTVLYAIGEGLNAVAGGGWEFILDAGVGNSVSAPILTTTNNDIVVTLTLTQQAINPKIKIKCSGGSGSATKFKAIVGQKDKLKGFFETKETADVEFVAKASTPPTVGFYPKGFVFYNGNPIAGGYLGWVCTVAGNPATWKGFGLIEA